MARVKPVGLFTLLILVASFLMAIPQSAASGVHITPSSLSAPPNVALPANQPPTANFTFTPANPTVNAVVSFDGHLSNDPDGVISAWSWSWGDGSVPPLYSTAYETHTFLLNGTFTVTLTVTDFNGQSATASANIKVRTVPGQETPPAPVFTFTPTFPLINQAVTFDASASRDSDGDPVTSYIWSIGDGTNLTQTLVPTLTHTFVKVGLFPVTLTVTDNHGMSSTNQVPAIIGVTRIPYVPGVVQGDFGVYSLSYNQPTAVPVGGQIIAAYQNITEVSGTNVTINYSVLYSNGTSPVFQFTNDVRIGSVRRGTVFFPFVTAANLIAGDPPLSGLFASYATILRINATAPEVIAGSQRMVNIASIQNPSFSITLKYDQATGLLVFYSVSTVYGGVNTTTSLFLGDTNAWAHTENAAPLPLFSWSPNSPTPGTLASFDASHSYDPDRDPIGYQWQFGDGSTATGISTSHTYISSGVYNVTLTVSDLNGGTKSSSKSITIGTPSNQSPIPTFTFTPTNPSTGQAVTFDATASRDPDGTITSYAWNFGDGQTGSGITTTHSYNSAGIYNVALNVMDNGGATGSVTHTVSVVPTSRVGGLRFNQGENFLISAVIDPIAGFAYFGTFTTPGSIVKVQLSDFTRVGSLTLNASEGNVTRAVIDTAAGFAYFGTASSPGVIVKVRLSDFTRAGTLALNAGENYVMSAAIDPAAGFAYFGTYSGAIVKVSLSNFTRVGSLTLSAPEYYPLSAVIDSAAGFAYFGTYAGFVVKVRLSNFTRVGSLALNPGQSYLYSYSAVIDSTAGFAYFSAYTSPSVIVKISLSTFTRVGSLTLNTGENNLHSAVIDTASGFAYFGTSTTPGIIVKLRLSTFTRVGALALNPGENYLDSAVIDSAAGLAYFGTYTIPGIVVEVDLSRFPLTSPPSAPSGLVATLGVGQVSLRWTAPSSNGGSPTTGYKVYRGISPGAGTFFAVIGNVTSYTDAAITNGQSYYYQVSALNSAGEGSRSNEASVTPVHTTSTIVSCIPSIVVINQVTSCVVTVTDTTTSPTTPTGTVTVPRGTCILAGTGAYATCSFDMTLTSTGSFSIYASYGGDVSHSTSSGGASVTVGKRFTTTSVSCTPATVVVNVQTSCTATVNDTSPGTVITPKGSVWFTIDGPGIYSAPICDVSGTGASSSCSVSIKPIRAGSVSVSADYLDDYAHHLSSGRSSVTVTGASPDAPTGFSSAAGNGKVTLGWAPPANNGGAPISGYNVYRAMASGEEVLIATAVASTTYVDAGLTNGQKYYYKVSAVNSVGEGPLSGEVTATPTSPPVSQVITSGGVTFKVTSNSTISNLQYNATSHQISFQVSGIVGTGVANMTVPKTIVPSGGDFNVTIDSAAPAPSISQDTNNYYVYVTYPSSTRTVYISFASRSAPENAAPGIFGLPPSIFTAILGTVGTIVSAIIGLAYRAKSRPKETAKPHSEEA